jgi:hypothetical protein
MGGLCSGHGDCNCEYKFEFTYSNLNKGLLLERVADPVLWVASAADAAIATMSINLDYDFELVYLIVCE